MAAQGASISSSHGLRDLRERRDLSRAICVNVVTHFVLRVVRNCVRPSWRKTAGDCLAASAKCCEAERMLRAVGGLCRTPVGSLMASRKGQGQGRLVKQARNWAVTSLACADVSRRDQRGRIPMQGCRSMLALTIPTEEKHQRDATDCWMCGCRRLSV